MSSLQIEALCYMKLHSKIHSKDMLQEAGFPVELNNTIYLFENDFFGSTKLSEQKCRCNKKVSLMDLNWFYANPACHYHPLKFDKQYQVFSCCGGASRSPGCVSQPYHISFYIPHDGDWLVSYKRIQWCHNIVSLDCEFVFTEAGMEVARVSVVDIIKGVVYDVFVQPEHKVLDYNTQYSGITAENFTNSTVLPLSVVQHQLGQIIAADSILVGHGLHSDLKGLRFFHTTILDTSILYPHFKGLPYRYSLAHLAQEYLGITIHNTASGHNSIQDAKICLQLVLLKCNYLDMIQRINTY